jgi:hypothetical protein
MWNDLSNRITSLAAGFVETVRSSVEPALVSVEDGLYNRALKLSVRPVTGRACARSAPGHPAA